MYAWKAIDKSYANVDKDVYIYMQICIDKEFTNVDTFTNKRFKRFMHVYMYVYMDVLSHVDILYMYMFMHIGMYSLR